MRDERIRKLAQNLVNYSLKVKPGEKVLIETRNANLPLVDALIREVYEAKGLPFVSFKFPAIDRALAMGCTREQLKLMMKWEAERLEEMDCYIGIRQMENSYEDSGVPQEQMDLFNREYEMPVLMDYRVPLTRWVALRFPTPAMAQAARMNTQAFEDFYFQVCAELDYEKMSRAMDPLKELMDRTDRVHITGPGTDLSFSIKGIGAVKCDGQCNIPDGEVYTAPVWDSVNGVITYNTESIWDGFAFQNIRFEFEQGKIVRATANDTERLNNILDTDAGARYIGEFAFGVNPYITRPMNDTLFDEKISGSFHFTPGNCIEDAPNGNKSKVHWDIVNIQTPEYGGGEISFDGEVIRRDGLFVREDLKGLNPENLK